MFFRRHKKISAATLTDLNRYINRMLPLPPEDVCAAADADAPMQDEIAFSAPQILRAPTAAKANRSPKREAAPTPPQAVAYDAAALDLTQILEQIDESFSDMLFRKIDEKHMTDAQCYKKAQIDRKLFSKIRSQRNYRPSKATAISFALALELSLGETNDLLLKAGYALSHSSKSDLIVEYFILHQIYDKFLVNEALYEFDQPLL